MPDLQLGPDDYRVRSKSGRWMNRDAAYTLPIAVIMAGLWIGFAWWNRAELGTVLLVSLVAVPSLALGLILGSWLKRFD